MDPPRDKPEDPRPKSFKYHQGAKAEFDASQFDFGYTSFIIDDNYIADPPRIQISIENINDNIDENFLRRELEKAGKIRMLEIVRHRKTRQHLGLAKIEFVTEKEAQACVETFNGKHMMGRQLNVFKDVRFLGLEKIKEDKLNPKPAPIIIKQQQPTPTPIIPPIANTLIPNVTSNGLFTSQQHSHLLPFHPQQLQKSLSSPQTGEYPSPTPSSLTTTPDSTGRPRSLDARIANLMKQSNNPLSAIVGIQPTPALPSFSAFNPKETNYYQTPLLPTTLKTLDHKQRLELNELRGADNNIQSNHLNQKANNNKSDRYDDGDDWNQPTKEVEKLPIKIELTERQIEDEVLPWCYRYFEKEMQTTLLVWLFDKKLKENLGYECIEKNQAAHREKLHAEKIKREQERNDAEVKKRLELRYLNSRNRYNRPAEEVRPKVNVIRQRTNDLSSMQDTRRRAPADMRRVNRSSAYVVDERHGSHTTSIDSFSDDEFNRSSSSSSFSGSSSGSSSPSSSSSSSSSFSSSSSVSRSRPASPSTLGSLSDDEEIRVATPRLKPASPEVKTENERDAIEGLLSLQTMTGQNKITDIIDENIIDVKPPVKKAGRKRKKVEELRVVKKQRSSAASPSEAPSSYKENEEELAEKEKYRFEERTALEKRRMLNDLLGTLTEEDIGFLKQVHEKEQSSDNSEVQIPFGSQEANWAHLASKGKPMIESKSESHPKWWRGCSRCDVINKSEKAAIGEALPDDNESKNPKKHTGVIQAATTSSRRDQRGDQRRIAALNPNIDDKLIKMYTTSTLQMRAKNLRFSRSRIHNWGLFACEKIASGDAVIEYVGEKIRPSVADHRENEVYPKMKSHDGSSYFFRVDHDVIDASTKGNKARFINHSCNPNCIAKVIKHDNGSNSIVIYAKQAIKEDEEITYDYKFPREDGENKILCKCGSHNCQKYLN